jgi:xylan 1,4-beta-xylosidase
MQKSRSLLSITVFLVGITLLSPVVFQRASPSPMHLVPGNQTLTIPLNCSDTNGIIRPFGEINDGPAAVSNASGYADLTNQYQAIGITSIRTHDLNGPTDIHTIFPNLSRDPTDASNYHFETSDNYITKMIQAGCHVYYRLGESAGGNDTLKLPPKNFTAWAQVCKHVTMHYNDGWDNGFHYNIRYWEVWNEPDLAGFWNGTIEQYYLLYQITAETLKAYNASLNLGGPCTSSVYNKNYTDGFLQFVTDHDVPLDFFSWHMYTDIPTDLFQGSLHIRTLLDSYGFNATENINSEWNNFIVSPQRDHDNAKNAAFTACCLTALQDARLDQAYRYRGTGDKNKLMRLLGLDLSLFTYNGIYKRPALTYLAMHSMMKDTPIRLRTPPMNASTGVTYLASISDDATNVSVLLSSFNANDTSYMLTISSLPWHQSYTVVKYLIDEKHHLQIVHQTIENGTIYHINSTLKTNSVEFYRFTTSTVIPKEGPAVENIPFLLRIRILDPLLRILAIILILFILQ